MSEYFPLSVLAVATAFAMQGLSNVLPALPCTKQTISNYTLPSQLIDQVFPLSKAVFKEVGKPGCIDCEGSGTVLACSQLPC